MCACIGVNAALYYVGPACLGLAFFALIGKIFYTNCFTDLDPVKSKPAWVQSMAHYAEVVIGGKKDPYNWQRPAEVAPNVYVGPWSNEIAMEPLTSEASGARMYDESIDLRLRYASQEEDS